MHSKSGLVNEHYGDVSTVNKSPAQEESERGLEKGTELPTTQSVLGISGTVKRYRTAQSQRCCSRPLMKSGRLRKLESWPIPVEVDGCYRKFFDNLSSASSALIHPLADRRLRCERPQREMRSITGLSVLPYDESE